MNNERWIVENKITGKQHIFSKFKDFKITCNDFMKKEVDIMFIVKLMVNEKLMDEAEIRDYFD